MLRPAVLLAAGVAVGCSSPPARLSAGTAGRPGETPVPVVHLFENHSSSLVKWRRAGVRDRVVVHVDGHSDLDWLPDATIARIAAARPEELGALELHPYALDGTTLRKFGIWNFLYPAARLGIAREIVWVVPDGTLPSPEAAAALSRDLVAGKMHGVSVEEATGMRFEDGRLTGRVLGIPLTICELRHLPSFDEPVLLDLDLDFLTTRSAETQEIAERPWIAPTDFVRILAERGVTTDVVTISYSTIGGYFPPENRWIGEAMRKMLASPGTGAREAFASRSAAAALAASGDLPGAVAAWRAIVAASPDDGSARYALARSLAASGAPDESAATFAEAVRLDPILGAAGLYEADRLWMNQSWEAALGAYRAYLATNPEAPFSPYARRREGTCLMHLGRDDEAIRAFRDVLSRAPDHADTHLDLGVLLRDEGDLEGAIAELERARKILPELGTYAMALGTTYLRAGRPLDAIAELKDAVRLRPSWAPAQGTLAALLLDTGSPAEAAEHAKLAVELQPENPRFRALSQAVARKNR